MKLSTNAFKDGAPIGSEYSFCKINKNSDNPVIFSENLNPDFRWSEVPENTQSFVLIASDDTCPTSPEDVNQVGREVPEGLPRADFFHWLLADIPAEKREIKKGEFSRGVIQKGKTERAAFGRVGLNDYTGWFSGDENMEGNYFNYDGPCPPWNDSLVHTYHFSLYALDIAKCDLPSPFHGSDLQKAIEGHVLDVATLSFTYTLNPRLKK